MSRPRATIDLDDGMGGTGETAEKYTWRQMAPWMVAYVLVGAAFPRFAQPHFGIRGRALAIYAVADALTRFAALQWMRSWAERHNSRRDTARARLTAELGREPTVDELFKRVRAARHEPGGR